MQKLIALIVFIAQTSFAAVVYDGDLIVVHPSKHYHTNPNTIISTNKLIQSFHRSVMLYQFEPAVVRRFRYWKSDLCLFKKRGE